jgi:hypothetical protein
MSRIVCDEDRVSDLGKVLAVSFGILGDLSCESCRTPNGLPRHDIAMSISQWSSGLIGSSLIGRLYSQQMATECAEMYRV